MATTDVTNQRPVFKSAEEFYAWDQANNLSAPKLPAIVSSVSPVNPVGGSTGLREEENKNKTNAADILKTVTDKSVADTMAEIKNLTGYRDPNAALNESELASVNAAAENAGAEYNPEIAKAQEAFRKGMPQAEISAGERGGFMSTQFSGMSAVSPTAGGTFVGQGGELKNIEDTYNSNINNLKVAQKQAMALAKQKAEEAIRTGKSESNKQAMELFKAAQDANTKAIELAQKKVDLVSSYRKESEAKIDYQIENILEPLQQSMTGDQKKDFATLEKTAADYGLDTGRLMKSISDYKAKKQKETLDIVSKKQSIAKDIPEGEVYSDPDTGMLITGTKDADVMDITQTVGGTEYKVRYDLTDKNNPKELFRISLGPRWKGSGTGSGKNGLPDVEIASTVNYLAGLDKNDSLNDVIVNSSVMALAKELKLEDGDMGAMRDFVLAKVAALRPVATAQKEATPVGVNQSEPANNSQPGLVGGFLGDVKDLFGGYFSGMAESAKGGLGKTFGLVK